MALLIWPQLSEYPNLAFQIANTTRIENSVYYSSSFRDQTSIAYHLFAIWVVLGTVQVELEPGYLDSILCTLFFRTLYFWVFNNKTLTYFFRQSIVIKKFIVLCELSLRYERYKVKKCLKNLRKKMCEYATWLPENVFDLVSMV